MFLWQFSRFFFLTIGEGKILTIKLTIKTLFLLFFLPTHCVARGLPKLLAVALRGRYKKPLHLPDCIKISLFQFIAFLMVAQIQWPSSRLYVIYSYHLHLLKNYEVLSFQYNRLIGPVGRVFANDPGDLCSIPGRVLPKTFKMVLDTSLINTRQYKVRIEDKVKQSRERSGALSYTSV